ncbi:hypothetical protein NAB1_3267 [Lactiplantibacillus plantarum]|nr:hypothetical protein NAB1_3267 [Lactiplantibacillus plantarum]
MVRYLSVTLPPKYLLDNFFNVPSLRNSWIAFEICFCILGCCLVTMAPIFCEAM